MSRFMLVGSENSAARAFLRVGLQKLLARLHRYATVTLGLAAMDAGHAGEVEAADLVNTLMERCLRGTMAWALPADASDDHVIAYACSKLRGILSNHRRNARAHADASCRREGAPDDDGEDDDGAQDEQADEAPDAFEQLAEQRGIADVVRLFEHDAEAAVHVEKMFQGKKRAEIAEELGCTAPHADTVRRRIFRRIAALSAETMNPRSEDEPPSSGPRGRHHEPQATQERQGAPRKPHRRAGGAGRRR
jgi:DNA-directed RNA polymerase specialized sigma24 family protein